MGHHQLLAQAVLALTSRLIRINPDFDHSQSHKPFNFFSWEMLEVLAQHKVPSVVVGMVRLYQPNFRFMRKVLDHDIRPLFADHVQEERASLHFSTAETAYYYMKIRELCDIYGLRFSTCYIGNDATGDSFEFEYDKGMIEGVMVWHLKAQFNTSVDTLSEFSALVMCYSPRVVDLDWWVKCFLYCGVFWREASSIADAPAFNSKQKEPIHKILTGYKKSKIKTLDRRNFP